MDKLKEKLHIGSSRRKSQPDTDSAFTKESSTTHSTTFDNTPGAHSGGVGTIEQNRDSIDSELATMAPHERVAYLQEFEHSDKHDEPKKGGLIEKLIARGNKRTEEQLEREAREYEASRSGAGASSTIR